MFCIFWNDLVHVDLHGPIKPPTIVGAKYLLPNQTLGTPKSYTPKVELIDCSKTKRTLPKHSHVPTWVFFIFYYMWSLRKALVIPKPHG